jgi:PLAT/LH2 domain
MGSLHGLRIRHDNAGSAPGWFVETIVVQDLKTYKKYRFICGEWLAKDQGDGNLERELHVEGTSYTSYTSIIIIIIIMNNIPMFSRKTRAIAINT